MTTTTNDTRSVQLSAELLASIQSRRYSRNMLQVAKAFKLVPSDRISRLTDSEWNRTLKMIDQAHPGWKASTVACSYDLCSYQDAA